MKAKYAGYIFSFLLVFYLILIGLGPIRRVTQFLVPDGLRHKTTVNSVCADGNRVYIFNSDTGETVVQVIPNQCPPVPGK